MYHLSLYDEQCQGWFRHCRRQGWWTIIASVGSHALSTESPVDEQKNLLTWECGINTSIRKTLVRLEDLYH